MVKYFIVYAVITIIISSGFIAVCNQLDDPWMLLTPSDIWYGSETLNWFGATLIWICLVLIAPWYFIAGFIVWLCTDHGIDI